MKHGIVLQNADHLLAFFGCFVLDLVGLREEDGGRALALPNLPLLFLRLLIGHPARVAALEGAHVHAENEDIDAVIALAGDGIEGRLRPAGLFRVPGPYPGLHAVLKFGDDAVREFLHRIAGRLGACAPRCVLLCSLAMSSCSASFRVNCPRWRGWKRHVGRRKRARLS